MITFITEDRSIFAVEQNVEKNGKFYDELMYAELIPGMHKGSNGIDYDCVRITWEDDWKNPEYIPNIQSAKQHVLDNYKRHIPYINGREYELE